MRRPSPFSASIRAGMTAFFAHSTTAWSENVVLSMTLHGPHQEATTSSMTGLPSAFARLRTSAKGLPSMNGMWTAAGGGGLNSRRCHERNDDSRYVIPESQWAYSSLHFLRNLLLSLSSF